MLTVCLVGGAERLAEACLGLIVQLADFRAQVGNDSFKLRASLQEFQAFGDQRRHRFCASFLNLASCPVVQLLTERDTDLLGHTPNHTIGQPAVAGVASLPWRLRTWSVLINPR